MAGALLPCALVLLLVWGGAAALRSEGLSQQDGPPGTPPSGEAFQDPELPDEVDAELSSGASPSSGEDPLTPPQPPPPRSPRVVGSPTSPATEISPRDWSIIGSFTALLASVGLCVLTWCCREPFLQHQLTFRHRPHLRLPFQPPVTRQDSGKEPIIQMEKLIFSPPVLTQGTRSLSIADLLFDGADDLKDDEEMLMVQRNSSTCASEATSASESKPVEGTEASLDQ